MQTRIFSLAGLAVAATAATGLFASSGDSACGRSHQIADRELRAAFAALDRGRDTDMTQVCALYRDSIKQSAPNG